MIAKPKMVRYINPWVIGDALAPRIILTSGPTIGFPFGRASPGGRASGDFEMAKSTRPRPKYSAEQADSVKSYRDVPIPHLDARFEYRPNCGGIYRKDLLEYRISNRPGVRVDRVNKSLGYHMVCITFCGKSFLVYAHRLAWALVHGYWPVDTIDHINMCRHDNRLSNLRAVTNEHNQHNIVGTLSGRNSTGFRGVFKLKSGLFASRVYHGGVYHRSPTKYSTADEANAWYRAMKIKVHAGYTGR